MKYSQYTGSMISLKTVEEFHRAIEEEFGKTLNEEEARTTLVDLTSYFDVLAQINHQDKLDAEV